MMTTRAKISLKPGSLLLCGLAGASGQSASLGREMTAAHNVVRSRVGVAPLTWSSRLADRAQEWADHLAARHQFQHSPNSPYGENLFEIDGGSATPADVVADWASEARDYDYRTNQCRGVCGHYTQIVWRGTKEVGCAMARDGRREIWVCEYDPPGNIIGRRPY
ncbi:MAG TPA: CAP domain-containing protein [Bryobacteraceae bacterium]|nr:CAP domain-containing protein [Bryobacteraceae bacterium]